MTLKSISVSVVGIFATLALAFAAATPASAASIPSFYDAVFDGQTEVWVNPGERIEFNALVEVDTGEVLHAISTDVIGDGLARECHDVSNAQGEIEREYKVTHRDGPPNTGDYGFQVIGYTADNMNQANALKGDTACTGNSDTLYNESDVVHVLPDGSNNDSDNDNPEVGSVSALLQQIADLQKWLGCLTTGQDFDSATKQCKAKPAPAKPAYCDQMKNYTVWYGQSGGQVSAYQQFLISNGFSIPAGATGNFFSQTQAAATAMGNACK